MVTPTQSAAPAPKPARFRWLKRGVLFLGVLAVLYALSAGPALLLAQRRMISTDTVVTVYFAPFSPLGLVMGVVPGADWLMKRYLGWWESLTPPPPAS